MKHIIVTIKQRGVATARFTGLFASTCAAIEHAMDMLGGAQASISAKVAA